MVQTKELKMNSEGNIRSFESDEEAKKAGYKTSLSPRQVEMLDSVPEHQRHMELALEHFMADDSRSRLGDQMSMRLRNAFRMGWQAAQTRGLDGVS